MPKSFKEVVDDFFSQKLEDVTGDDTLGRLGIDPHTETAGRLARVIEDGFHETNFRRIREGFSLSEAARATILDTFLVAFELGFYWRAEYDAWQQQNGVDTADPSV